MSAHPSGPATATATPARAEVTLPRLREMAARGEKIAMLTCYDATFAALLDANGVDVLLVGDSLGNVVQGRPSTLGVSLHDMAYHTGCAARGRQHAWLVADLPFGSFEVSPERAFESAAVLMSAGAQMVKIEGAGPVVPTVRFLVERGIPVCAHLGLTPQRVHALGGYRVQGREADAAAQLRADAEALADAGAALLVLECVPAALARAVTEALPRLPTIGIGAGAGTSGQVLVLHDLLGITPGKRPRFVRDFSRDPQAGDAPLGIAQAVARYVADVKAGRFPDEALHAY